MKLSDAVTFTHQPDGQLLAKQYRSRECSVLLELSDACDNTQANILTAGTGPSLYDARPFVLRAVLTMSAMCFEDGDDTWLNQVTFESRDYAVARALVSQPPASTYQSDAMWIGATGVGTVTYSGDTSSTQGAETYARTIMRARSQWYRNVVPDPDQSGPILHLSSMVTPELARVGLLHRQDGELVTIMGDPVVSDPGYDPLAGDPLNPVAFWTPKFEVAYGDAEGIGLVVDPRLNTARMLATLPAMINLAPCSVVRVASTYVAGGTGIDGGVV